MVGFKMPNIGLKVVLTKTIEGGHYLMNENPGVRGTTHSEDTSTLSEAVNNQRHTTRGQIYIRRRNYSAFPH
jgi:hypothetical protein